MAHRSKKKHLKHLHEHEPATPPAKSPVAKAEAAAAGVAKPARRRGANGAKKRVTSMKKRATQLRKRATDAKLRAADTVRMPEPERAAKPRRGIVRRLAGKATETLSDKLSNTPRKVISRAKARVKARVSRVRSMLRTEA